MNLETYEKIVIAIATEMSKLYENPSYQDKETEGELNELGDELYDAYARMIWILEINTGIYEAEWECLYCFETSGKKTITSLEIDGSLTCLECKERVHIAPDIIDIV